MPAALSHVSKLYGTKEARITPLLTDPAGGTATYAGISSLVTAAPAPTTTAFGVTAGDGVKFTVGRTVTINGTSKGIILSIATDTITLASALAGAPVAAQTVTMESSLVLPGSKHLKFMGTTSNKDLRGDNMLLDSNTTWDSLELEANYAKLSLDVLATLFGGTVVDAGTTPNRTSTLDIFGNVTFGYCKLEARIVAADTPGGDVHWVAWKCLASSIPDQGSAEEDFMVSTLKLKVLPRISDNKWYSTIYNETAAQIA